MSAGSLAAVAPPAAAAGLVPAYPWGATPTGVVAIAGYLSDDTTVEGLFTATRDCSQLSCVSQLTTEGSDRDPAWSPTGREIAFTRVISDPATSYLGVDCVNDPGNTGCIAGRYLMILDTDTGLTARLTKPIVQDVNAAGIEYAPTFASLPTWSPLGDKIAFGLGGQLLKDPTGHAIPNGFPEIAVVDLSVPIPSVQFVGGYEYGQHACPASFTLRDAPSWSPDGTQLAYLQGEDTGFNGGTRCTVPYHLFIGPSSGPLSSGTGVTTPGTTSSGDDWSPDGTTLVDQGSSGIWIISPTGSSAPVQLDSFNFHTVPSWSPDGDVIAILGNDLIHPDGSSVDYFPPVGEATPNTFGALYRPADVQCKPGSCLTIVRVEKLVDPGGALPATFTYATSSSRGNAQAQLTVELNPLAPPPVLTMKVGAGVVTVSEQPEVGWHLTNLVCDRSAQVSLASASTTFTAPEGTTTRCSFTNTPAVACSDVDNDGVCDLTDNCLNVANPDQADLNANGIGDVCEGLSFTWSVPSRYDGTDTNGDGLIDMFPPNRSVLEHPGLISPASWPMDFVVRDPITGACPGALQYQLLEGTTILETSPNCQFRHFFPEQGGHTVTLVATFADGSHKSTDQEVWIKDWLIVALGDSVASGEGNPDIPGSQLGFGVVALTPARWENQQCHRSARAAPAQAAAAVENADEHSSVTFLDLACSGASIRTGLLGPFGGVQAEGKPDLPPQVDELASLLGPRVSQIDALTLSVGADDIHFADIIKECASTTNQCQPGSKTATTFGNDLNALTNAFKDLNTRLTGPGSPFGLTRDKLVFTGLYDALVGDNSVICPTGTILGDVSTYLTDLLDGIAALPLSPLARAVIMNTVKPLLHLFGTITQDEALWGETNVLAPLISTQISGTAVHGWHYLDFMGDFETSGGVGHGYCASAPNRWVRTGVESLNMQPVKSINKHLPDSLDPLASLDGTIHPNAAGHSEMRDRILQVLSDMGLPTN